MLTENKDAVSCRSGWHCESPATGCLWIAFHELQRGELRSVGPASLLDVRPRIVPYLISRRQVH